MRRRCDNCKKTFQPQKVPSAGQPRRCPKCGHTYKRMSKPIKPFKIKKYRYSSEWARKQADVEA